MFPNRPLKRPATSMLSLRDEDCVPENPSRRCPLRSAFGSEISSEAPPQTDEMEDGHSCPSASGTKTFVSKIEFRKQRLFNGNAHRDDDDGQEWPSSNSVLSPENLTQNLRSWISSDLVKRAPPKPLAFVGTRSCA